MYFIGGCFSRPISFDGNERGHCAAAGALCGGVESIMLEGPSGDFEQQSPFGIDHISDLESIGVISWVIGIFLSLSLIEVLWCHSLGPHLDSPVASSLIDALEESFGVFDAA